MPTINSMNEYQRYLQQISDRLIQKLVRGEMDANWSELTRERVNGRVYRYFPFDCLEPHQIYWFVRVRPDHRTIDNGGNSVFSLEIRAPDMPTTAQRMQMMNSFVLGLCYYIADHGLPSIRYHGSFDEMKIAARDGLDADIDGINMRREISRLATYSARGLEERGYSTQPFYILDRVLTHGNDADLMRNYGFRDAAELRNYTLDRLRHGE